MDKKISVEDSITFSVTKSWLLPALALLPLIFPFSAYAHTGVDTQSGWVHGFIHPMVGMDHILTMIAVGLWAAQMRGGAIWLVPFTFVVVMTLGGIGGMIAFPLAYAELGIIISLLVLGILLAAAVRLPLMLSVLVVGVFAFCHGYAHGVEMPQNVSGMTYSLGFITATALLHACGIGIAVLFAHLGRVHWLQPAGMAVTLYGGSMLFSG